MKLKNWKEKKRKIGNIEDGEIEETRIKEITEACNKN